MQPASSSPGDPSRQRPSLPAASDPAVEVQVVNADCNGFSPEEIREKLVGLKAADFSPTFAARTNPGFRRVVAGSTVAIFAAALVGGRILFVFAGRLLSGPAVPHVEKLCRPWDCEPSTTTRAEYPGGVPTLDEVSDGRAWMTEQSEQLRGQIGTVETALKALKRTPEWKALLADVSGLRQATEELQTARVSASNPALGAALSRLADSLEAAQKRPGPATAKKAVLAAEEFLHAAGTNANRMKVDHAGNSLSMTLADSSASRDAIEPAIAAVWSAALEVAQDASGNQAVSPEKSAALSQAVEKVWGRRDALRRTLVHLGPIIRPVFEFGKTTGTFTPTLALENGLEEAAEGLDRVRDPLAQVDDPAGLSQEDIRDSTLSQLLTAEQLLSMVGQLREGMTNKLDRVGADRASFDSEVRNGRILQLVLTVLADLTVIGLAVLACRVPQRLAAAEREHRAQLVIKTIQIAGQVLKDIERLARNAALDAATPTDEPQGSSPNPDRCSTIDFGLAYEAQQLQRDLADLTPHLLSPTLSEYPERVRAAWVQLLATADAILKRLPG
jgi:hypothetical protein